MTGCVVCNLDKGFCEFCPTPPTSTVLIIDRDPGDETVVTRTSRSYRATYKVYSPLGTRLLYRDFIGPDGYLSAVELAEDARESNEFLLSVQEMT